MPAITNLYDPELELTSLGVEGVASENNVDALLD